MMSDRFKFERRLSLSAGLIVIAFVLFLVARNEPFADPNLVVEMRIVLSLAISTAGATLPGFLNVRYTLGGFSIRAAGALALFVLTFFGTPKVESLGLQLPDAQASLGQIRAVDFRTEEDPTKTEDQRATGPTVVTIPTLVRSMTEPARKATLTDSSVTFDLGSFHYTSSWRYFVNMNPEQYGFWLAIVEDAHDSTIPAGETFYREILHEPRKPSAWKAFVDALLQSSDKQIKVVQTIIVDGVTSSTECHADLEKWRDEVRKFIDDKKVLPGRITIDCQA
jgi:hypothetical protein